MMQELSFKIRSSKGIVSLWDLKTRRARQTLDGHDGQGILGLDFLSNGTVIRWVCKYHMVGPCGWVGGWGEWGVSAQKCSI